MGRTAARVPPLTSITPSPFPPSFPLSSHPQVAGYKVKIMLAEPKSRRGSPTGTPFLPGMAGARAALSQGLLSGLAMASPYASAASANSLLSSLAPGQLMGQQAPQGLGLHDFSSLQHAVGALGSDGFSGMPGQAQMAPMRGYAGSLPLDHVLAGNGLSHFGLAAGFGGGERAGRGVACAPCCASSPMLLHASCVITAWS